MSILKAIMHHYNAATKSYDTLHPETEASQITDWHSSIMASLASKTLGSVVDAVTTDSVLGKLIKLLLNASGVKYLIDTNGYICFGSFFGGAILQWGTVETKNYYGNLILPINAKVLCGVFQHYGATAQYNGFNIGESRVISSMKDADTMGFIAVTK